MCENSCECILCPTRSAQRVPQAASISYKLIPISFAIQASCHIIWGRAGGARAALRGCPTRRKKPRKGYGLFRTTGGVRASHFQEPRLRATAPHPDALYPARGCQTSQFHKSQVALHSPPPVPSILQGAAEPVISKCLGCTPQPPTPMPPILQGAAKPVTSKNLKLHPTASPPCPQPYKSLPLQSCPKK